MKYTYNNIKSFWNKHGLIIISIVLIALSPFAVQFFAIANEGLDLYFESGLYDIQYNLDANYTESMVVLFYEIGVVSMMYSVLYYAYLLFKIIFALVDKIFAKHNTDNN